MISWVEAEVAGFFLYRVVLLVVIVAFLLYTALKGNGKLPWEEKAFLLFLALDFGGELAEVSARLARILEFDVGGIVWSGLVRTVTISLFAVILWIRTKAWVRMREEGRRDA